MRAPEFLAAALDLGGAHLKPVQVADGAIRTRGAGMHRHWVFNMSPDGEWIYRIRGLPAGIQSSYALHEDPLSPTDVSHGEPL
jgi:hypothetical protein